MEVNYENVLKRHRIMGNLICIKNNIFCYTVYKMYFLMILVVLSLHFSMKPFLIKNKLKLFELLQSHN